MAFFSNKDDYPRNIYDVLADAAFAVQDEEAYAIRDERDYQDSKSDDGIPF